MLCLIKPPRLGLKLVKRGVESDIWPMRNAWLSFDTTRKRTLPSIFGVSPNGRTAVIFCAPNGGSHSIIPLGKHHLRFNFEVDPDTRLGAGLDRALAYRRLGEVYGIGESDVEVYRQAVYPLEGRLARQWRRGRVFLAGDAAHVMTPFLGQGGCSAFRDAINLAWKLDLVLRGEAHDTLLDTYEAERLPHVRVHVEGSDRAGALAFINDPVAAAARDERLRHSPPPDLTEPKILGGVLDLQEPRHALIGDLGPQATVRYRGRNGRFDDVFGWGFQLIGWEHDPAAHLAAAERALLTRLGATAVGLAATERAGMALDMSGAYAQFFSRYSASVLLVRPDFVVFGVGNVPSDANRLVAALGARLHLRHAR